VTLFQIAIAVAAISALTQRRVFLGIQPCGRSGGLVFFHSEWPRIRSRLINDNKLVLVLLIVIVLEQTQGSDHEHDTEHH